VEDARTVVFADPAWQRLASLYERTSSWLDRELDRLQ
jgi:hypothetical protein